MNVLDDEMFEDTKRVIRNCTPKDRQYNGQKKIEERQTIQWSKENRRETDNTMVKRKQRKDRQYNGQKKIEERQTIQQSKENRRKTNNDIQNAAQKTEY